MRSVSPESPFDPLDRAVMEFDALWDQGVASLDHFWARVKPGQSLSLLSALIKVDLIRRFERHERPRAADYLGRFPELARECERAISIIYEEFCLLEENGEAPSSVEFCERYEPWRDSLASQLVHHRELSRIAGVVTPKVRFPVPGERFASFRLRSILGKGGAAQVYLAIDEELGDRRVALKISASMGREPSILANLDHRGIVPILTVAESAETGLRGICMPYRPGETLEGLVRKLARGGTPRKAKAVWDALKPAVDSPDDDLDAERTGWSGFPARGTYHEAVAFIGLCLAGATGYLHSKNVLHRDIKPANILLAFREGPQLLDFNLAYTPNQPEHAQAALKGGTLPYMAPEQLLAFLNPLLWESVRFPADIYSLGLVLKELATGLPPDAPDGRLPLPRAIQALHDRRSSPGVPLRELNPSIPPALESIISRCLEFDPAKRYEKAEHLAADLRQFLDRRPLQTASNTSLMERGSNFVHRNSIAAGMLIILGIMSALVGMPRATAPALNPAVKLDQERSDSFRQALALYLSKDRASWERARAIFEKLEASDSRSARPPLYLGLTLEKLGDDNKANAKFRDVEAFADLGTVLDEALSHESRSPTLLTLQAGMLFGQGKFPEAVSSLTIALEEQPDRIGTLELFAKLEKQKGDARAAIGYLRRAIASGERRLPERTIAGEILGLRLASLSLLAREVDIEIESRSPPTLESAGRLFLTELEANLGQIEAGWRDGLGDDDRGQQAFTGARYSGIIASGRAAFEAKLGRSAEAEQHFDEAIAAFDACRKLIPTGVRGLALQREVEDQIRRVEDRKRRFLKPDGGPPAKG